MLKSKIYKMQVPQNVITAVNNITLICNEARMSKTERAQIEADLGLIIKELEEKYPEPKPVLEKVKK